MNRLLLLQLPGASAGKPDVGGAAKDAAKKTPLGFINVGDLALDLPGSNVSKDTLPNNVKPGDAAGLPKGPTAKPPSSPSLPKVFSYGLCLWLLSSGGTHDPNSISTTQVFPYLKSWSCPTLKLLVQHTAVCVCHICYLCALSKSIARTLIAYDYWNGACCA